MVYIYWPIKLPCYTSFSSLYMYFTLFDVMLEFLRDICSQSDLSTSYWLFLIAWNSGFYNFDVSIRCCFICIHYMNIRTWSMQHKFAFRFPLTNTGLANANQISFASFLVFVSWIIVGWILSSSSYDDLVMCFFMFCLSYLLLL